MDNRRIYALFRKQLPFQIPVLGRGVTFSASDSGRILIQIADLPTGLCDDGIRELEDEGFRKAFDKWEGRKEFGNPAPDLCYAESHPMCRLRNPTFTKEFLRFFLGTSIGVRLCICNTSVGLSTLPCRRAAIDQAFLTWNAITNYERTKDGQLDRTIACSGYRRTVSDHELHQGFGIGSLGRALCGSAVTDATGACHHHRRPASPTLFNHYPYFEREGYPELAIP